MSRKKSALLATGTMFGVAGFLGLTYMQPWLLVIVVVGVLWSWIYCSMRDHE